MRHIKKISAVLLASLASANVLASDLLWDDVQRLPAYRDRAAYLSCKTRGASITNAIDIGGGSPRCVMIKPLLKGPDQDLGPAVQMTLQEIVDLHWPNGRPGSKTIAVGVIPSTLGPGYGYQESATSIWVAVKYR